ncbi:cation/H(+) antiporter 15-like isoform X2 [Miscanthus floridulus]|uniref:cation/H(+) antiporter 15-like isoform X2 n=1 Tax=Miscanthus floridulus TaxID=154761 RepID=UPI003458FA0B
MSAPSSRSPAACTPYSAAPTCPSSSPRSCVCTQQAGALLGPSLLGQVLPHASELFATPEGWVQLNTVGAYAFALQIFVIGVKTYLGMIVKSGKKAVAIAFFGTVGPHLTMYAAAVGARVPAPWKANFMLTNLNVWWSLSAFIVVCTTLGDLNLLSSKLGRLAMSAALIGDFANTFSIAGITSYLLASSPSEKVQRIGFLSLLTSAIFIGFLAFVACPAILRLMRDVPEGGLLCEARLVAVLFTTIVCSFAGEIIGLHATYERQEHGSPGAPSPGSGAGGTAAVFLRHCRWDPERLENEWFSDERRIREAVGLTADQGDAATAVNDRPLTCAICFDVRSAGEMISAGCAHYYCRECWSSYIHEAVGDGARCLVLRCLDPSCGAPATRELVREVVAAGADDRARYETFVLRSYVEEGTSK